VLPTFYDLHRENRHQTPGDIHSSTNKKGLTAFIDILAWGGVFGFQDKTCTANRNWIWSRGARVGVTTRRPVRFRFLTVEKSSGRTCRSTRSYASQRTTPNMYVSRHYFLVFEVTLLQLFCPYTATNQKPRPPGGHAYTQSRRRRSRDSVLGHRDAPSAHAITWNQSRTRRVRFGPPFFHRFLETNL
jgi:hypothetical protein